MNYRLLGNSGLSVSEICLGVMTFTGADGWTHLGELNQRDANQLVNTAMESGVNFFDTADFYSSGTSEKMLGIALEGKRNDAIICTKYGFEMHEGENGKGLSRKRTIEACEDSLKRLKTDYIDLYLIHALDFVTPIEETLEALTQLVADGKVRYIGCSNFPSWVLTKAFYVSEKYNYQKLIAHQAGYNILARELELDIIPASIEFGIGTMVWGPLHGGILTGKYRDKANWPMNTRIKKPGDHLPYDTARGNEILDQLAKIAEGRGVSVTQVSLNYLLRKNGISSVVVGARTKDQILENVQASDWELNDNEMNRLDEISEPNQYYPHWYYNNFWTENYKKFYLSK
ncbi:MAG: aldo/keto reductase [Melioribacteraceae bacterium]|nr:aldo/keto reductase [Melioribacteraceae bacterium]MCF8265178.1 aldo/keto reductase [Melioribacteraceae bacterium]MCF8412345.1 aldo/keto reductase [Melioribacteraceae bacterium]MCF8432156.1 aldo/keto reductase [Melioribacteraceae bacterium]